MRAERTVLDTSVLISAALQPKGLPRAGLDVARSGGGVLIVSPQTWDELTSRLARPRLDRHFEPGERERSLADAWAVGHIVPILGLPVGCRDPDDGKVIETALRGGAEVIVTGDEDLLAMAPRPELRVLAPAGVPGGRGVGQALPAPWSDSR